MFIVWIRSKTSRTFRSDRRIRQHFHNTPAKMALWLYTAPFFLGGMVIMQLESLCSDGCLCIRYVGELDHHAARAAFRETEAFIDRFLPRRCILDFSGITFMDSSGIAVVLRVKKRMAETDGDVFLLDPAPQCARVLRTSGIERFVAIKYTEGEAVR